MEIEQELSRFYDPDAAPGERWCIVLRHADDESQEEWYLERRLAYRDRHLGDIVVPRDKSIEITLLPESLLHLHLFLQVLICSQPMIVTSIRMLPSRPSAEVMDGLKIYSSSTSSCAPRVAERMLGEDSVRFLPQNLSTHPSERLGNCATALASRLPDAQLRKQ